MCCVSLSFKAFLLCAFKTQPRSALLKARLLAGRPDHRGMA